MKKHLRGLLPSLILALGILGATALSVRMPESSWWVLTGPLALAAATVAASVVDNRLRSTSRPYMGVALGLGAIIVVAAAIVALKDPSHVPSTIPILGAAALFGLIRPGRCARQRRDAGRGA